MTICAPVKPIRAQKLLMASGGKPRRLRAVKVKSRGSSQSAQIPLVIKQTPAEQREKSTKTAAYKFNEANIVSK